MWDWTARSSIFVNFCKSFQTKVLQTQRVIETWTKLVWYLYYPIGSSPNRNFDEILARQIPEMNWRCIMRAGHSHKETACPFAPHEHPYRSCCHKSIKQAIRNTCSFAKRNAWLDKISKVFFCWWRNGRKWWACWIHFDSSIHRLLKMLLKWPLVPEKAANVQQQVFKKIVFIDTRFWKFTKCSLWVKVLDQNPATRSIQTEALRSCTAAASWYFDYSYVRLSMHNCLLRFWAWNTIS